jgi:hypothetical protein
VTVIPARVAVAWPVESRERLSVALAPLILRLIESTELLSVLPLVPTLAVGAISVTFCSV